MRTFKIVALYFQPDSEAQIEVAHLEIERSDKKLRFCPLLLHPKQYHPDTVDLTR